jgi:hypothetical protein
MSDEMDRMVEAAMHVWVPDGLGDLHGYDGDTARKALVAAFASVAGVASAPSLNPAMEDAAFRSPGLRAFAENHTETDEEWEEFWTYVQDALVAALAAAPTVDITCPPCLGTTNACEFSSGIDHDCPTCKGTGGVRAIIIGPSEATPCCTR